MFRPRPKQQAVLDYTAGWMGVSAVPGSGKTHTLSALAARLIAQNVVDDRQEVLIVTLVNSAVDNFSRRIGDFIKVAGLLPNFGYRVRTLHGLAHDIVRERPDLAGADNDFRIIDEQESESILQDAVGAWVRANPAFPEAYLDPNLPDGQRGYVLREQWLPEALQIAKAFIQQAKNLRLSTETIRRGSDRFGQPLPLAEMCHTIYTYYQRGLAYRGAVDFQDLIWMAYRALQSDDDFVQRLRHRWPYILEDEAQDSSKLQEDILQMLVGEGGNWVRVGDPNQAIYETFTTASPEHLRRFLQQPHTQARTLPNSGRSTHSIIALANALIDWTLEKHPVPEIREMRPLDAPYIEPAPPNDPQPNPPDDPRQIYLHTQAYSPGEEAADVIKSVKRWLETNADKTAAILVPRNERGAALVKQLQTARVPVVELLRSTSTTRKTAGGLAYILDALSNPNSATALAMAFTVWRRDDRDDPESEARLERIAKALRTCKQTETYLHPRPDNDWLDGQVATELAQDDDSILPQLVDFRALMRRWQGAVVLPIDQLILTLTADLFVTAADLAIAHSLALHLRQKQDTTPHWRLPDFVVELRAIAQNKRKVAINLDEDANGYDPERHKGTVTVTTVHRAKGLEWDRVYLLSVNAYDYPSAEPHDRFIGEKTFVRDKLNLQAEAMEQLERLADPLPYEYEEGLASRRARLDYAAERLRLLYVGITRARRELVITWNTGRQGDTRQATPFIGLQNHWKKR